MPESYIEHMLIFATIVFITVCLEKDISGLKKQLDLIQVQTLKCTK